MAESTGEGTETGPVIRDRRRIDPVTGRLRPAEGGTAGGGASAAGGAAPVAGAGDAGGGIAGAASASAEPAAEAEVAGDGTPGAEGDAGALAAELAQARSEAQTLLTDVQRLQAEFVNYRRRVERDRGVARDAAIAEVLESLLPVLDDIHLARQHGDLTDGPFSAIADKLETTLGRYGLARYGEPGEEFDPEVHEALLHTEAELAEGTKTTTVVQIMQPGYRAGDRVLRPARVAVADPPQE